MIIQHVLSVVDDPELPVVWVDESLTAEFWSRLAKALDAAGYRVLELDAIEGVNSHEGLLSSFCSAAGWPVDSCPNLNALKDNLLGLDDPPTGGWVVLYRKAGPLRQSDEATFEDLVEVFATVHETKRETKTLNFKLVVSN